MTPALHCLAGFVDDFGNLVQPYKLKVAFCARYHFYIGDRSHE